MTLAPRGFLKVEKYWRLLASHGYAAVRGTACSLFAALVSCLGLRLGCLHKPDHRSHRALFFFFHSFCHVMTLLGRNCI